MESWEGGREGRGGGGSCCDEEPWSQEHYWLHDVCPLRWLCPRPLLWVVYFEMAAGWRSAGRNDPAQCSISVSFGEIFAV